MNDRVAPAVFNFETGERIDAPGSIPQPVADRIRAAVERDPILRAYVEEGAVPATFSDTERPQVVERMLKATPAGRALLKERGGVADEAALRAEARRRTDSRLWANGGSPDTVRRMLKATPPGRAALQDAEDRAYAQLKAETHERVRGGGR